MTDAAAETESQSGQGRPDWTGLPEIATALGQSEVVSRLDRLARDGKLAGFRALGTGGLFEVAAFGEPFDRRLVARAATVPGGTRLSFRAELLPRLPLMYLAIIAVSIWPGAWLTHSMLSTYWTWYGQWPEWVTWAWYLPLTVLPLPFVIPRMVRKSEQACYEHAVEQIAKIAGAVGGSTGGGEGG